MFCVCFILIFAMYVELFVCGTNRHDVFQLRTQLENDLLDAQSKIEDLEKLVQGQGTVRRWRHLFLC